MHGETDGKKSSTKYSKLENKASVVFINSHPIQYFVPLYRYLHEQGNMDLEVVYFADDSVVGKKDEEFGVHLKWDIPLLEGYRYRFFKNYAWNPSVSNRMWGQINWGIISYLWKKEKSIVVVHGWIYVSNILAIIFGRLFGHTICLRAETPLSQELSKPRLQTKLKHLALKLLFAFVQDFLYVGSQNKAFYQYMGIKEQQLFYTPYCVDNDRFRSIALQTNKQAARNIQSLSNDKKIILFSGKYIPKKNPLDLLKAFNGLQKKDNLQLVMVGDGVLRKEMEQYIEANHLKEHIILTGFINQSRIPYYYAAADIFVMCSGIGETWGLAINEAMNFKLPLIVSKTIGAADDLVQEGINGWTYPEADISELTSKLQYAVEAAANQLLLMGEHSLRIVDEYDFASIEKGLLKVIHQN